MTQDELDALPINGGLRHELRVIDGRNVRVPIQNPTFVLWTEKNEPFRVFDVVGTEWRVGWHKGVRYKQRITAHY